MGTSPFVCCFDGLRVVPSSYGLGLFFPRANFVLHLIGEERIRFERDERDAITFRIFVLSLGV